MALLAVFCGRKLRIPAELLLLIIQQVWSPRAAASLCVALSLPSGLNAEIFAREWLRALHSGLGRTVLEKRRARHEFYVALLPLLLPCRTAFLSALNTAIDNIHLLPHGPGENNGPDYLDGKAVEIWDLVPDVSFRFRLPHKLAASVIKLCNFSDRRENSENKANINRINNEKKRTAASFKKFVFIFNTICDLLERKSSLLRRDFVSSLAYHAAMIGNIRLVQIVGNRGSIQSRKCKRYLAKESRSVQEQSKESTTSSSERALVLTMLDGESDEEKINEQISSDNAKCIREQIILAAERGQLHLLKKWTETEDIFAMTAAVNTTAISAVVNTTTLSAASNSSIGNDRAISTYLNDILKAGLANGHIHIMEWALRHGATFNSMKVKSGGNISLDIYRRKQDEYHMRYTFLWVIKYCWSEIYRRHNYQSLVNCAIQTSFFSLTDFSPIFYNHALQIASTFEPAALLAVEHGHWDAVKWALDRGYPWNNRICTTAAKHGYKQILDYAYEKDHVIIKKRNTEKKHVLGFLARFFVKADDPVDGNTGKHQLDFFALLFNAAVGGHVEILDWIQNVLQSHGLDIADPTLPSYFEHAPYFEIDLTAYRQFTFERAFRTVVVKGLNSAQVMDWFLHHVFKESIPSDNYKGDCIVSGNIGVLEILLKKKRLALDDDFLVRCVFDAMDIANWIVKKLKNDPELIESISLSNARVILRERLKNKKHEWYRNCMWKKRWFRC